VEEIKQRLVTMWTDVKQSAVDKAIEHWWQILQASMLKDDTIFEQLL